MWNYLDVVAYERKTWLNLENDGRTCLFVAHSIILIELKKYAKVKNNLSGWKHFLTLRIELIKLINIYKEQTSIRNLINY